MSEEFTRTDAVGVQPGSQVGKATIEHTVKCGNSPISIASSCVGQLGGSTVVYMGPQVEAPPAEDPSPIVTFRYTNWEGNTARRKVIPIRMFWGSTEYHYPDQWLLEAFDLDKKAMRTFAMRDIKNWTQK